MKYQIFIILTIFCVGIMSKELSEDEMNAQWAVELKPEVNPISIAEKNGFLYEGKHPVLPNIHLFRVAPQHRTRDAHPIKVESLQNDNSVIWSEPQIPRSQMKRNN